MTAKRSIPRVPKDAEGERRAFDEAVKEDLEAIMGRRGSRLEALPATATTAEIIAKINAIIAQLQ